MRISIFNGSHRSGPGNTATMIGAFTDGAASAGADVATFPLVEHKILFCRACKQCWFATPGQCPLPDDMPGLQSAFLAADVVVLATPLYVDNVSGLLKTFLDRLITVGDPHWDADANGASVHRRRHPLPTKLVFLANCGYPEPENFDPLRILARRMARNFHCELAGEIYRGGGGLLTRPDATTQPFIDRYLTRVRQAGSEVATAGRISPATQRLLEEPLLPNPDFFTVFRDHVNILCDTMAGSTGPGQPPRP